MTDVMQSTADENRNIINCNSLVINAGGTSTFGTGAQQLQSVQTGLVAHSSGGQANATPINSMAAFVSTVAVAGDSLVLPSALPGMEIAVINQTATATGPNVFPAVGQTINALSANTAIAVAPSTILIFFCGVAGSWWTK